MDTNFLKLIYIYFFLVIPFVAFGQMPSTPNSPYTVRWYQVSQNGNSAGDSMDSLVSQKAFNTRITRDLNNYWRSHANGIYYNTKNVGIGDVPNIDYELRLYGGLGLYQDALNGGNIRNTVSVSGVEWNNYYNSDYYKIQSGTNPIFLIHKNALSNLLTINNGVGINNLYPAEMMDVDGNIKLTGYLNLGTATTGTIADAFVMRNISDKKLYTVSSTYVYDNNPDTTRWWNNANAVYPKNLSWKLGVGTQTPQEGIHLIGGTDTYIKSTGTGTTAVSGFIFNNSDQTWSVRVRGDVNDQFELFDNTSNKIVITADKNSPTYSIRIDSDSSVSVYDFYVDDSITAPNLPEFTNARMVGVDNYGNFGVSDPFGFDSLVMYLDTLINGWGISAFLYNGLNKDTVNLDTTNLKIWINSFTFNYFDSTANTIYLKDAENVFSSRDNRFDTISSYTENNPVLVNDNLVVTSPDNWVNPTNTTATLETSDAVILYGEYASGWELPDIPDGTKFLWYPRKSAIAIGTSYNNSMDNDSIGEGSQSIGWNNRARGISSTAIGLDNQAAGDYATAIGYANFAKGFGSVALGWGSWAYSTGSVGLGEFGHAIGYASFAANNAVANGEYATGFSGGDADGNYSFVMGQSSAIGNYSTSFGLGNSASSYLTFMTGRYGEASAGSADTWVESEKLFVVGNGTDVNNKNNAFEVLKNGNTTIDGTLKINKLDSNRTVFYAFYDTTTNELSYAENDDPVIDTTIHHIAGYGLNGDFYNQTVNRTWEVDSNEFVNMNYFNDAIARHDYDPDASIITKGTQTAGTVDSCDFHDTKKWTLAEVAGVPGYDVQAIFDSVDHVPNRIIFHGYYNGSSSHNMALQLWNYDDGTWETYHTLDSRSTIEWVEISIVDPTEHVQNDSCKIRFYHSTSGNITHRLYVDYLILTTQGFGSSSDHGELAGLGDDDHTQYALLAGRSTDILEMNTITAVDLETKVTVRDSLYIFSGGSDGTIIFGKDKTEQISGISGVLSLDADKRITISNGNYDYNFTSAFYPIYISSPIPQTLGLAPSNRWGGLYTTRITDDATNVKLSIPVATDDSLVTINGTIIRKKLANYLKWSDTTAANGIGVATYDDLRSLDVGELDWADTNQVNGVGVATYNDLRSLATLSDTSKWNYGVNNDTIHTTHKVFIDHALVLQRSLTATTGGTIFKQGVGTINPFIHDFGVGNTGTGYNAVTNGGALNFNSGSTYNTGTGYNALANLSAVSDADYNTAYGFNALNENTNGDNNTAIGSQALKQNTTGNSSIAIGNGALYNNVAVQSSLAIGNSAMYYADNSAVGTISYNTAIGHMALQGDSPASGNTGRYNSTTGYGSMEHNSTGDYVSAFGTFALHNNKSGDNNTGFGARTLYSNVTGIGNVALGYYAGYGELLSNKLYIENSNADSTDVLIFGDFALEKVRLNATFQVRDVSTIAGAAYISVYDSATNQYHKELASHFASSIHGLDDHSDVALNTPDQGDLLMLNETNQWINWTPNYLTAESDPIYATDSSKILWWKDTTAVSAIGIATYDDLRDLDLGELDWSDTTQTNGVGIATYDDLRNISSGELNWSDTNQVNGVGLATYGDLNTLDLYYNDETEYLGIYNGGSGVTLPTFGEGDLDIAGLTPPNLSAYDNTYFLNAQGSWSVPIEEDGDPNNETEVIDEAYNATNFNGDTYAAVSQDDLYDQLHISDADDDGKANLLDVLTQGIDFNEYEAISMTCDSGINVPSSPSEGQWFLQITTGRKILMQYTNSTWNPIMGFGNITLYVDKTDGTDGMDYGTAIDADAFASIQYAINIIPSLNTGSAYIYINEETYTEALVIGGKNFQSSNKLYFYGVALDNITPDISASADGFTRGRLGGSGNEPLPARLRDNGAFVAAAQEGKWVEYDNSGTHRLIYKNTADTLYISEGTATSVTTYEVRPLQTTITQTSSDPTIMIMPGQIQVEFNYCKIIQTTATTSFVYKGENNSICTFNYCYFDVPTGTNTLRVYSMSQFLAYFSYFFQDGASSACIAPSAASYVFASGCVFRSKSASSYVLRLLGSSINGNALNICYGNPSTYAINAGNGASGTLFQWYFDGYTSGITCDVTSNLSAQNEDMIQFVNCTYDIVKPLAARNSTNTITTTSGVAKLTNGWDSSNDYNYFNYGSSTSNVDLVIDNSQNIGINTSAPDKRLEINSSTGACLQLTYNDNNGSAVNKSTFDVSSGGDLTMNATGDDVIVDSNLVLHGTYNANITTLTADKTLDNRHHTILVDNSAEGGTGRVDITLPDVAGRIYIIKLIDLGGTGNAYGFTINATRIYLTKATYAASYDFDIEGGSVTLQCDGSAWWVIDWSGTITGW